MSDKLQFVVFVDGIFLNIRRTLCHIKRQTEVSDIEVTTSQLVLFLVSLH
jgi:hypothetical protein